MRNLILIAATLLVVGCASQNALNQPELKDLSIFTVGTEREQLILEVGSPAHTEKLENGDRVDLFSFVQGYSHSVRASRAAAHGLAEIATLGLWSIAGSQIEESYNGTILGFKVTYDESNKVTQVEKLVEKDRN
tara:strand:+ start:675 stop:1076 length:402 start_codon:yes stop_codon:yes gene_type:complete